MTEIYHGILKITKKGKGKVSHIVTFQNGNGKTQNLPVAEETRAYKEGSIPPQGIQVKIELGDSGKILKCVPESPSSILTWMPWGGMEPSL